MRKQIVLALFVFSIVGYFCLFGGDSLYMLPKITTSAQVRALFPVTPDDIKQRVSNAIEHAQKGIDGILAINPEERTFNNTVLAFDRVAAQLGIAATSVGVMRYVHPDAAMCEIAQQEVLRISEFSVDVISNNSELYKAIKAYADGPAKKAALNAEEKRYLQEIIKDFEKSGLGLPQEEQEIVKQLKKDLTKLSLEFSTHINIDKSSISVQREDLAGLEEAFIASLHKNEDGTYVLGVDYPTVHTVMDNCSVESTRRALSQAFKNRAYPANEEVLKKIIALRDKLAKKLGFETYAHLNLDEEMAKTPERVQIFLDDLEKRSRVKIAQEMELLKTSLPEGVSLTSEGQFKPWDLGYTSSQYKKKHLKIDEEKIKEYFPMQHTVDQLLDVYSQFLGITFKQESLDGLWHSETRYIAVYKKDGSLLGHLILDLHPRANKYSHACQIGVVSAVKTKSDELYPAVVIVLANFPKSTGDRPALLKRDDVSTFFHEFGHALHSLFGATEMAGFSGTNVPRDFVEMPSQMLEEWLYDREILKKVSCHYQTGEPLSDEIITKIQEAKRFGTGYFVRRQVGLAQLSLACFDNGADKDPYELKKDIFNRLHAEYVTFDPNDHFEASFGHLTGYGAAYYSYLWSKVYALDMFNHIKQFGLLNYEIGKQYAEQVIGKGYSVEPDSILRNFLGREPSTDAFFEDLGL